MLLSLFMLGFLNIPEDELKYLLACAAPKSPAGGLGIQW